MTDKPSPAPPGAVDPQVSDRDELAALRSATLGDYDILGQLGRGGMATVYLAHDLALDRRVAIKVMSPVLSLGDGVERFKREARTSASLSHPNIIPVYAVQHTERLLYFVMKFVDGRSLDSIITELGPLPVPMIQAILGQVASAFGYAHRRGVVHRDIKPGNILIDDEGWVVVTDFGIAKVSQAPQLTSTGLSVGTPTYMSPEQVMGQGVTGASDQYSLGVVAYEMLTGKPPFEGTGTMAMMYAHVHHPPQPVEELRPDCPQGLRAAVTRMLAKDPAERWVSIEDIIAVIGSPSLTPDDPTRSQLIAIAKTGQRRSIGVTTPKSPIPLLRTPIPPAPRKGAATEPLVAAIGSPVIPARHRRSSALSLALAVGGVLVGVGSIAVALRTRTNPRAGPAADTGAASAAAIPPAPVPTAPRVEPPPATPASSPQRASAPTASGAALPRGTPGGTSAGATKEPDKASPAEREAVETAISAYASALDAGSVDEARRAFPSIPEAQVAYLDSLFTAGGHIRTIWKVGDITVDGERATARVRGATRTESPEGAPSVRAMDARVVLDRQADAWTIRSMAGPGGR
jgi:serine/threonine protein kinase